MYPDFYRLKKAPFHITPDPEFLFLSPSHKAALGALVYGIEERQGFVALIGEVGLGKTTILRSYLERANQQQLRTIYIFNSNVAFSALLKTICREFGVEATEDVFETVNRLHQVLIDEYKQGRNVALIVDEAQHMPIQTLEHLRMLSNLETSTEKLIQIVLVGQPEFEEKLNTHALRQLKQRLVIRANLLPLTEAESIAYMQHRLAKVMTTPEPIFTKGALAQLAKHAKGTPRVLNILCTNALIQGFGYGKRPIHARIIKEVVAEYMGEKPQTFLKPRVVYAGLAVLLAILFWLSPYSQVVWSTIENRGTAKPLPTPPAPPARVAPPKNVSLPAPVFSAPPPEPAAVPAPSAKSLEPPSTPPMAKDAFQTTIPVPSSETTSQGKAAAKVIKVAKRGDHITSLAVEVYGAATPEILEWIRKNNPQLRNMHRIDVGEQIVFPPMPTTSDSAASPAPSGR